ncbi:MAG TPA: XrtA/PEP-CTERM system amidotransferase [Blastocatellia bacterium]|nr:XrtA/PEP-CTERM system amidotransferase [Blastocatellia bacterium]
MCGICGIWHYGTQEPVSEATLRRSADVIAHRGPDDDGFHLNGRIGLGHRRLSIIDVAGGHQPIYNEDGAIAIVFNGEIYNYRTLAALVEARGHRLRTRSDTETIVHLYEEFGEKCVAMLEGMFAFAIWDAKKQTLLLARDRLGKKPLYYSAHQGRFVFGSELKSVIASPQVPRETDTEALADYFSYQYIPSPKTIFRHVRKLRPGHYLVVTAAGVREQEYWDIDFSITEERSEDEWGEMLREACRQAVAARLMSEVPLGAFLSGGIDSSVVVALMSRLMQTPVVTASIGFTEEKYSEAADARWFAEMLHADHHERLVKADAAAVIEKLAWHYDEPFADSSAVPTYYVSRVAREFVTVALSGDGGDESFAGYRRYRFDVAENRVRAMLPAALRRPVFGGMAAVYPKADWLPQPLRAKTTLHNLSLDPARAYYNSVYGAMANERAALMGREVKAQLNGYNPFDVFGEHYQRAARMTDDLLSRVQYVDIKTYLTDDVLAKVDRASMAVSLEVRCPLLDHRVMELAARIPSSLKLRGQEGKYIFKRAMRGLLPAEILTRRKQGFSIPLAEWLRGELRPIAESALFDSAAQDELLDQKRVRELWQQHQSGLRDYSRPLWTILMFRLWQQKFTGGSAI